MNPPKRASWPSRAAFWLVLLAVPELALVAYVHLATPEPGFGPYRHVPFVEYAVDRIGHERTPDGFPPTWNAHQDAPGIWVFGGSTVHGGFTREPSTACEPERPCSLPSRLSELLHERGLDHTVRNLGMLNYGIAQERILFEEMLRRNERPAIAIFYDGANDAETRAGIAGYPNEYPMIRDILEDREGPEFLVSRLERSPWKGLSLLDWLINRWHRSRVEPPPAPNPFRAEAFDEDDEGPFVADVLDAYRHHVRLIRMVCREFGVACFFVWQPLACYKTRLTEAEMSSIGEARCGPHGRVTEVYARVAADPELVAMPEFANLALLFADRGETVFLDYCHVDEASGGHRVIANRLLEVIEPALRQ